MHSKSYSALLTLSCLTMLPGCGASTPIVEAAPVDPLTAAQQVIRIEPDMPDFVYYTSRHEWLRAVTLLEPLAGKGNNDVDYLLGVAHVVDGQEELALPLLEAVANRGDGRAYYPLGVVYHMEKDHETAVRWFQQAELYGTHRASVHLAVLYAQGQGNEEQLQSIPQMLERVSAVSGLLPMVEAATHIVRFELGKRNGPTGPAGVPEDGCRFYVNDTLQIEQESSIWCDNDELVEYATQAVDSFVQEGSRIKDGQLFLNTLNFWLQGTFRGGPTRQHLEGTTHAGGIYRFRVFWRADARFTKITEPGTSWSEIVEY